MQNRANMYQVVPNVNMNPNVAYYPTNTVTYQQPNNWYGQNFSNIPSNNQEISTNIQWIEGQNAAESYILPNGINSWALWDSKQPIIYVKSFDSNGKPFTKRLQYVDLDAPPVQEETTVQENYVTQEQLQQISEQFTSQVVELTKKLNDFKSRVFNINKKEK